MLPFGAETGNSGKANGGRHPDGYLPLGAGIDPDIENIDKSKQVMPILRSRKR